MSSTKRVSIDQLRPGMYVLELDQPWHKTPFFSHKFVVLDDEQIARLRQVPVKQVVIDTSRGRDIDTPYEPATTALAAPQEHGAEGGPNSSTTEARVKVFPTRPPSRGELAAARELRRQAVASVQQVLEGLQTGVPVDCPALQSVVTSLLDDLRERPAGLMTLTFLQQIQRFDDNLYHHVVDVSVLSLAVGTNSDLEPSEVHLLGMGALLHDVGHLRLPRNLLRHRGHYTAQEQRLWEQHPQVGVALLANSPDLTESWRRIVAEHHERLDGSGHPAQLRDNDISPLSQLVGLVDQYDRMVSSRGSRPALTPSAALKELFEMGRANKFHKHLVETLVQTLGVYPIGSVVLLNTGERAVVVALNPDDRLMPLVKVVADSKGRRHKNPTLVDLSGTGGGEAERYILYTLDPLQEQIDVPEYLEP